MLSSWPHCMVIYACASQRNPQRTGSRRLRWSWICHKPGKFVSQHYRTGRIMTSGRSWGRYTCPTVFSTIKGKNNSIFYTFCTLHSWSSEFLVWNVSIDPQVHFTGQHGQHLSEHGPSDGRCERGDEIQAGLPPGERRRGEKLPRLM